MVTVFVYGKDGYDVIDINDENQGNDDDLPPQPPDNNAPAENVM